MVCMICQTVVSEVSSRMIPAVFRSSEDDTECEILFFRKVSVDVAEYCTDSKMIKNSRCRWWCRCGRGGGGDGVDYGPHS